MFTTLERTATLARARKKRAYFLRAKPHWGTALRDNAIVIDALEALVTIDLGGLKNVKEKKEKR